MWPVTASFGNPNGGTFVIAGALTHICNKYLNCDVRFALLTTSCKDLCCEFYFPSFTGHINIYYSLFYGIQENPNFQGGSVHFGRNNND